MRTLTIEIIGTDWTGIESQWIRQPWTDSGRLTFDRRRAEDWKNIWQETGDLARVDAVAVGIRGARDLRDVDWAAPAVQTYRGLPLMPWYDTVGLPDMVNPAEVTTATAMPFDFLNDQHIELGVKTFAMLFFDIFKSAKHARSLNGRLLLAWWSLSSNTGWGFTNQKHAQRLLDRVDRELEVRGFGPADHIVDKTWLQHAPDLHVHAAHDWFEASLGQFRSVRDHHGTRTGVVVPSFAWPGSKAYLQAPHNGDTLAQGLAACVAAGCHYILIEGHTDTVEGAEVTRTAKPDGSADDTKLRALRAHMDLTNPLTNPEEPEPIPGGIMNLLNLAISTEPILKWTTGLLVQSPLAPNRYAMRWTQPDKTKPGHPDPNSKQFLCVNPDGTTEAKGPTEDDPNWKPGEWESSQPVKGDDVEIRWFTQNAAKDQSAAVVYGLQQFAA